MRANSSAGSGWTGWSSHVCDNKGRVRVIRSIPSQSPHDTDCNEVPVLVDGF